MDERKYVEIPGSGTHELPPLLVRSAPEDAPDREALVNLAEEIVDSEDLVESEQASQQQKLDLALHLTDQYYRLVTHWQWGDSILEWIRQCEITFQGQAQLRHLLHKDVWPHAGRSSFVDLLLHKDVPTHGVGVEQAVGMRLTFRQPPPIACFSNQFLFYLNSPLADTAYRTWAGLNVEHLAHLPPDRFYFQVLEMSRQPN